ncbi:hypothetical protein CSUI_002084 [Cystoisospora suis]|uniref:Uncharacterized protein n=1 Tax=Cystoisospora suis TaxID=483139 RepID=A0A2C6LA47_9APIC|nr:hypothetical protein CSUI_002084 [Cystoisospora suis]
MAAGSQTPGVVQSRTAQVQDRASMRGPACHTAQPDENSASPQGPGPAYGSREPTKCFVPYSQFPQPQQRREDSQEALAADCNNTWSTSGVDSNVVTSASILDSGTSAIVAGASAVHGSRNKATEAAAGVCCSTTPDNLSSRTRGSSVSRRVLAAVAAAALSAAFKRKQLQAEVGREQQEQKWKHFLEISGSQALQHSRQGRLPQRLEGEVHGNTAVSYSRGEAGGKGATITDPLWHLLLQSMGPGKSREQRQCASGSSEAETSHAQSEHRPELGTQPTISQESEGGGEEYLRQVLQHLDCLQCQHSPGRRLGKSQQTAVSAMVKSVPKGHGEVLLGINTAEQLLKFCPGTTALLRPSEVRKGLERGLCRREGAEELTTASVPSSSVATETCNMQDLKQHAVSALLHAARLVQPTSAYNTRVAGGLSSNFTDDCHRMLLEKVRQGRLLAAEADATAKPSCSVDYHQEKKRSGIKHDEPRAFLEQQAVTQESATIERHSNSLLPAKPRVPRGPSQLQSAFSNPRATRENSSADTRIAVPAVRHTVDEPARDRHLQSSILHVASQPACPPAIAELVIAELALRQKHIQGCGESIQDVRNSEFRKFDEIGSEAEEEEQASPSLLAHPVCARPLSPDSSQSPRSYCSPRGQLCLNKTEGSVLALQRAATNHVADLHTVKASKARTNRKLQRGHGVPKDASECQRLNRRDPAVQAGQSVDPSGRRDGSERTALPLLLPRLDQGGSSETGSPPQLLQARNGALPVSLSGFGGLTDRLNWPAILHQLKESDRQKEDHDCSGTRRMSIRLRKAHTEAAVSQCLCLHTCLAVGEEERENSGRVSETPTPVGGIVGAVGDQHNVGEAEGLLNPLLKGHSVLAGIADTGDVDEEIAEATAASLRAISRLLQLRAARQQSRQQRHIKDHWPPERDGTAKMLEKEACLQVTATSLQSTARAKRFDRTVVSPRDSLQTPDQQLLLQFVEALRNTRNGGGPTKQVRLSLPEQTSKPALQRQRRRRYVGEHADRGPDSPSAQPSLGSQELADLQKLGRPAEVGVPVPTHLDRLRPRLSRIVEQSNRLEERIGEVPSEDGGRSRWQDLKPGLGKGPASDLPGTLASQEPFSLAASRHGRREEMAETGTTAKALSSPSISSSGDADNDNLAELRTCPAPPPSPANTAPLVPDPTLLRQGRELQCVQAPLAASGSDGAVASLPLVTLRRCNDVDFNSGPGIKKGAEASVFDGEQGVLQVLLQAHESLQRFVLSESRGTAPEPKSSRPLNPYAAPFVPRLPVASKSLRVSFPASEPAGPCALVTAVPGPAGGAAPTPGLQRKAGGQPLDLAVPYSKEAAINSLVGSPSCPVAPVSGVQHQDGKRELNDGPLMLLERRVQQVLQGIQQERARDKQPSEMESLPSNSSNVVVGAMVDRLAQQLPQLPKESPKVRHGQTFAENPNTADTRLGTADGESARSMLHHGGKANGPSEVFKEPPMPFPTAGPGSQLTEQQRLLMRLVQQEHRRALTSGEAGALGTGGSTTMSAMNTRAFRPTGGLLKQMQVGTQVQPQLLVPQSEGSSQNRHPHSSPLPPDVSVSPVPPTSVKVQPFSRDAALRSSTVLANLARELSRCHGIERHGEYANMSSRGDRRRKTDAVSLCQQAASDIARYNRLGCAVEPAGALLRQGSRTTHEYRCSKSRLQGRAAELRGSLSGVGSDEDAAILREHREDRSWGELASKNLPDAARVLPPTDVLGAPSAAQWQKGDASARQRQRVPDCILQATACQNPRVACREQQPQQLLQQAKLLQAALVALSRGKGALSPAVLAAVAAASPAVSLLARAEESQDIAETLHDSERNAAEVERGGKRPMHSEASMLRNTTPHHRRDGGGESVYSKHRLLQLGWTVVQEGRRPTIEKRQQAQQLVDLSDSDMQLLHSLPFLETSSRQGSPRRRPQPCSVASVGLGVAPVTGSFRGSKLEVSQLDKKDETESAQPAGTADHYQEGQLRVAAAGTALGGVQQQQKTIVSEMLVPLASPAAATCGSSRPVSGDSFEESEHGLERTDASSQGPPECNDAHLGSLKEHAEPALHLPEQRQSYQKLGQDSKSVPLPEHRHIPGDSRREEHENRTQNGQEKRRDGVVSTSSVNGDTSTSIDPLLAGVAGRKETHPGGKSSAETTASTTQTVDGLKKHSQALHQGLRVSRRGSVGSALEGRERVSTGPQTAGGRKQQRGQRGGSQAAPRTAESDVSSSRVHKPEAPRSLTNRSAGGSLVTGHAREETEARAKLVDVSDEAIRRKKKKKPSVLPQQSGSHEIAKEAEPDSELRKKENSSASTTDHVTGPEGEQCTQTVQGKSLSVHEKQVHVFLVDAAHVNTTDAGRCRN